MSLKYVLYICIHKTLDRFVYFWNKNLNHRLQRFSTCFAFCNLLSSSSGSVPGSGVKGYATPSQSVLGCPFTHCKLHSHPVNHVVTPLNSRSSSSSLPLYYAFEQVSLGAFVSHHMTVIAHISVLFIISFIILCTILNSLWLLSAFSY